MGRNLTVLVERLLPPRVPPASRILVDLCENVHIHSRDMRQEFSVGEFLEHCDTLTRSAADLRAYLAANPEYSEQAYADLVAVLGGTPSLINESPEPAASKYWPRRLRVELIHPHPMGGVHLHWRDFRLNISRHELRVLAESLVEAVRKLDRWEGQHGYRDAKPTPMATLKKQCAKKRPLPGAGHFAALLRGKGGRRRKRG